MKLHFLVAAVCSLGTLLSIVPSAQAEDVSKIFFTVAPCVGDSADPTIRFREPNVFDWTETSVTWKDAGKGLLSATVEMKPGWRIFTIQSPRCHSSDLPVGVLPGHVRHVPVTLCYCAGIQDYTFMLAGELPMPGMAVSIGGSSEPAIVDDDAYYLTMGSKQKYNLKLWFDWQATIPIDLSEAADYAFVRRDVTLGDLANFRD